MFQKMFSGEWLNLGLGALNKKLGTAKQNEYDQTKRALKKEVT